MISKLTYENAVEDCVERFAEVRVDNIHCPFLVYPSSHALVEGYQISYT